MGERGAAGAEGMNGGLADAGALWRGIGFSICGHALLLLLFYLLQFWQPLFRAPPQQVLITKLVRLGTPRDKNLLPQKDEPPPTPPPPTAAAVTPPPPAESKAEPAPAPAKPTPAVAPAAKPPATAQERARALTKVDSALDKLRRKVDGDKDGAVDGDVSDATLALIGNRYATIVQKCLKNNYVIEGSDLRQVQHLSAVIALRIAADGRIVDFKVVQSPGVPAFEQAIARAVRRCGKVEPPPAEYRSTVGKEGLEITFVP